jgi:putative peptidoglycan lipid II flippase
MTATSFFFYSLAVIGYACQEIFNRVFYAFKQYRLPMFTSLLCIGLNLALNFVFYRSHGIAAISLSTSACMSLYAVITFLLLRREIGSGMGAALLSGIGRVLAPLGVMALILWFGHSRSDSLTAMLMTIAVSGLAYLAVAYMLGFGKLLRK